MSVASKNFYRRQLPETCVDFSSEHGKKLFTESLLEGNANIYFKLAAQFRTQEEPAYCGLSTLVMVLNSLEVDPGKVWKAPWRFYHETMLDCCVPLENVKKSGITLDQFSCLANCNRLNSNVTFADENEESLSNFRSCVKSSVRGESTVIVASYDRSRLGQTGSGHFSPIAAYHSLSDYVLILDVARFKYPPHWVRIDTLYDAMKSVDRSSKNPRGFVSLQLRLNTRPLIMYGVKAYATQNDSDFATSSINWKQFLLCDPLEDEEEEFQLCCRKFGQFFSQNAICCTQKTIEADQRCSSPQLSNMQTEACMQICTEVRKTRFAEIFSTSAVAALLIAWPFETDYSERSNKLMKLANEYKNQFSLETRNEIDQITNQLRTLQCCSKPPPYIIFNQSNEYQKTCRNVMNRSCSCKTDVQL